MQTRQGGFTLIELIVVIVILGILAATALPKFVNVGSDARVAVMKGVEGSMRAANGMIYAKAATLGRESLAAATVTIQSSAVALAYGFASTTTELAKVMDLSPSADFTIGATSIGHARAQAPTSCQVGYTAATGAAAPASYALAVTNCD